MKSTRHTPEQIIKKLREEADMLIAAGKSIGQVAQALWISEQTFHRWRNQYGGMMSPGTSKPARGGHFKTDRGVND